MERVCPSCGKDPGSGSLCRQCGARAYRFAVDDIEMPDDDLIDDSALIDDDIPLDEIAQVEIPSDDPSTWLPESRTEPVVADPYIHTDAPATWVPVPPSSPTPPPGPGPVPAQATEPKRSGCGCGGCLVALFFILMAAVVAFSIFSSSFESPRELFDDFVNELNSATSVTTAEPGPCLDLVIDGALVVEWTEVPCSGPHDVEQFHSQVLTDGPFPGTSEMSSLARDTCIEHFEGYVGRSYATSAYYYDWLVPTEQGWDAGDRELVCTIVSGDGEPLTGPAMGSGR